MLDREQTAIYGSRAEVLSSQSNLTIGGIINVFYESIAAVQAASHTVLNASCSLSQAIVTICLEFLVDILKDYADKPNGCN